MTLEPPIECFYSSPFYRCIQTIDPTLELLEQQGKSGQKIRGDNGIGEWYGTARFDHPSPATPDLLNSLFPRYDTQYQPTIVPSVNGESIADLHDRIAYALHKIIERSDREGVKAIIICSHAASILAIGRALTGRMPDDIEEQDFKPFTCGLSKFSRKSLDAHRDVKEWKEGDDIPRIAWKNGAGVGGGWNCELNGDCSFLSGGEERGWYVLNGTEEDRIANKCVGDSQVTSPSSQQRQRLRKIPLSLVLWSSLRVSHILRGEALLRVLLVCRLWSTDVGDLEVRSAS